MRLYVVTAYRDLLTVFGQQRVLLATWDAKGPLTLKQLNRCRMLRAAINNTSRLYLSLYFPECRQVVVDPGTGRQSPSRTGRRLQGSAVRHPGDEDLADDRPSRIAEVDEHL